MLVEVPWGDEQISGAAGAVVNHEVTPRSSRERAARPTSIAGYWRVTQKIERPRRFAFDFVPAT
jgi:hypothetical protein